ncbi:transposase [Acaryochloris marina MBIC11017]|uniref:Transposase n=1 Tax=Acaryochloris marina (strain MBIC 11017) TaxID=329726 RepID=B0C4E2_ACAM1|nr:transposase [Acaryochloris marina MBIC11017]
MSSKRRQYSAEFKAQVVLQLLSGEKTSSELCRIHTLHSSLLNRWRKEFLAHASSIFESQNNDDNAEAKIAQLERLVGQLTLQLEIAKKASLSLHLTKNGRW